MAETSHDSTLLPMGEPNSNHRVLVEIDGVSACQRCARGQGCGAGIFNHGARAVMLRCTSDYPVRQDQQVTVEFDDGGADWLCLVAGAYGLPTLGLIGASLLARWIVPSAPESGLALAAACGLAGGIFAWRRVSAGISARLETGMCLQSGRIVSVTES